MRISVLALQGAFAEHRQKLAQLGVDSFEMRQLKDWDHGLCGGRTHILVAELVAG